MIKNILQTAYTFFLITLQNSTMYLLIEFLSPNLLLFDHLPMVINKTITLSLNFRSFLIVPPLVL